MFTEHARRFIVRGAKWRPTPPNSRMQWRDLAWKFMRDTYCFKISISLSRESSLPSSDFLSMHFRANCWPFSLFVTRTTSEKAPLHTGQWTTVTRILIYNYFLLQVVWKSKFYTTSELHFEWGRTWQLKWIPHIAIASLSRVLLPCACIKTLSPRELHTRICMSFDESDMIILWYCTSHSCISDAQLCSRT